MNKEIEKEIIVKKEKEYEIKKLKQKQKSPKINALEFTFEGDGMNLTSDNNLGINNETLKIKAETPKVETRVEEKTIKARVIDF